MLFYTGAGAYRCTVGLVTRVAKSVSQLGVEWFKMVVLLIYLVGLVPSVTAGLFMLVLLKAQVAKPVEMLLYQPGHQAEGNLEALSWNREASAVVLLVRFLSRLERLTPRMGAILA
jgi:hypothetical protein